MRSTLPLLLGDAGVLLCLFLDDFENAIDGIAGVERRRNADGKLVPHPLTGGGEIEVLAANGEAVHEGDTAAGGVAPIGEVARLKKCCLHEAKLGDLAPHAIDFNPVADANSLFAHQDEPPEKGKHEILQHKGQSRRGDTKNGRSLMRGSKDKDEDDCGTGKLHAQLKNHAQRLRTPSVDDRVDDQPTDQRVAENHAKKRDKNESRRLQNQMQESAMLTKHLPSPLGINSDELLLSLDSIIVDVRSWCSALCSLMVASRLLRSCAASSGDALSSFGLKRIVLIGQRADIFLGLLHSLAE